MKLSIEGSTEEIKNVLQAISGSKEHGTISPVTRKVEADMIMNAKLFFNKL
ncbi:MAG: hypothetical protein ABF991_13595 [Liquorilactobacillus hordei]|uniref:hypothetical protein n=1 Tax=Liquorilactobacillus hordei TaxID=468911 RepID=UPI0039E85FE3